MTREECDAEEQEIKEALFGWAWPKISRALTQGFADHYKRRLAESQTFKESE